VLCADIDRDGLDAAVNRLQGHGHQVIGHPCDMSDAGQVEELMAHAAELADPTSWYRMPRSNSRV